MQQDDRRADCCFPGTQNTRPAVGRAPHPSAAENGPWLTSAVLNHMPSVIVSGCRDMATLCPTYFLRRATPDDAPAIRAIEECSVQKFSTIPDLAHLAQPGTFTPNSISGLNTWLSRGRVFLVMDSSASEPKAVGIIAALPKDNTIYIAEISVLAEHNGKGVGGMLLDAVFDWARELAIQTGEEVSRVSLTCYKDVPWNGPWYRRKGFVEVEAESLGIEHEEKMELDRKVRKLEVGGYKRCCMLWTEQRGRV